jgi:hypothetical protein
MYWELWDVGSRNRIADFESEAEALQAVREIVAANRPGLIDDLTLLAMYDDGEARDTGLPVALDGKALKVRLAEIAQETSPEVAHKVHKRIRTWLTEEGWRIDDVPVPPDAFNIVAIQQDGRAINIFQNRDDLDHIALSLRWSRDRVQQTIGTLTDAEIRDVMWNIYRDATLMGVDVYDLDKPDATMILRTHLYFDGLTKETLMQSIQLVNRAYALAMRTSLRALEAPGRAGDHAFSPEDLRRIVRPLAQIDDPLALAG